jgi:hypothetical protein
MNRKTKDISINEAIQNCQKKLKLDDDQNGSCNNLLSNLRAAEQGNSIANKSNLKRTHLSTTLPLGDCSRMSYTSSDEDLSKKPKFV